MKWSALIGRTGSIGRNPRIGRQSGRLIGRQRGRRIGRQCGRQASDGVREQPRGFSKVLSFGVSLLSLPPPPAQLLGSTRTSRILADFEDYFEYGQRMFQHLLSFALNSCSASLLGERSGPPLS
jgi:hypothetical protein